MPPLGAAVSTPMVWPTFLCEVHRTVVTKIATKKTMAPPPRVVHSIFRFPQCPLFDKLRGNGPPNGIPHIRGSAVREPYDIHRLQVLRHALVPAPFLDRRRARLRTDPRHPHL